ncbi:MAG: pyridoxamine 5'-phosphate oxidase family protein [Bacteroidota bacterium]
MDKKRKIKNLIERNQVGIFITQNNGKLFSRPIAFADVDDENCVWFFTDVNSGKIDDILENENVNFSFANHSDNAYVSVSGKATLITDQDIIDEKWSIIIKAWFPEGKQSKRLVLVKVEPETVQYWDGSSSRIVQAYDVTKALLTGKSYVQVANSENEIVEMK